MDATIAEWIMYHDPKSKKQFVEELCLKGFPHLLRYIELHEKLKRRKKINPFEFREFLLKKSEAMQLVNPDCDFNVVDGVELFSSNGIRKILKKEARERLKDLDSLDMEYRAYRDNWQSLRMT